jgi:ABC-2 type transport system ATP-binding protein
VRDHTLAQDRLELTVGAPHEVVPSLLELFAANGVTMDGLLTRQTSLEDVFVKLTGRHLRDEGGEG